LGQQEFAAVVRMGEVYSKSANFEAFRTILSEKEKSVSDFRLSFNPARPQLPMVAEFCNWLIGL
jgi:hypothetical protein